MAGWETFWLNGWGAVVAPSVPVSGGGGWAAASAPYARPYARPRVAELPVLITGSGSLVAGPARVAGEGAVVALRKAAVSRAVVHSPSSSIPPVAVAVNVETVAVESVAAPAVQQPALLSVAPAALLRTMGTGTLVASRAAVAGLGWTVDIRQIEENWLLGLTDELEFLEAA